MFRRHSEAKQSVETMTQSAPKGTVYIQIMMVSLAVAIAQNLVFQHLAPMAGRAIENAPVAVIKPSP